MQALKRIAALYAVEAEIRGQSPDERRRERQALSNVRDDITLLRDGGFRPARSRRQWRVSGTKRTGSRLRVTVRPSASLRISSRVWIPPGGPIGAISRPPGAS
jgi:hypothetical protein